MKDRKTKIERRLPGRYLLSAFVLISILLLGATHIYLNLFKPLSYKDEWEEIGIPHGVSFKEAVNILNKEGFIRDRNLFILLGRITGVANRIRSGYYNLNTSMSPWDVFDSLKNGSIIEYTLTIPEGSTLEDIADILSKKGFVNMDDFLSLARDKELLQSLNIDAPSLEGYLFPDTYRFPKGMSAEDIISMMVGRMREEFGAALRQRAAEIGFDERATLTLASIIEREAQEDWERPIISAVYHNRLNKGMPLQADPTAIYGVKSYNEKITRKDLQRKTPYNTYQIIGLPPGPIASPGIKSIKAALYPAQADYLYFVSKNDGTHYFSKTSEEHLLAVQKYQLERHENRITSKKDTEVP